MQSATSNSNTTIPVFTGQDGEFPFYKMRFMAVVCGLGNHYHHAMEGLSPYDRMSYDDAPITLSPFKTPRPRTQTTPQGGDEADGTTRQRQTELELKQEAAENRENYLQISRHIFSILIRSIGEEPLKRLVNAGMIQGDGIGAWKLLCTEYESVTSVNQRRLFNELINLKMEGKLAKLHDYLYAFKRITSSLNGMKIKLPEQLLVTILLAGLSNEYEQIINILNSMADLELDGCMTQLKTFQATNEIDTKRREMSGYSGQQHTPTRANRRTQDKNTSKRRGMMDCYNCNKTHMGGEFECKEPCRVCGSTNHVRFHCPDKGKRKRDRKQEQNTQQGNSALVDQLSAQFSRILGAALSAPTNTQQQHEGNGGSVNWGINDMNLNEMERP